VARTHRKSLASALPPEEVLDRFRQLVSEKGWMVVSEDEVTVQARSGMTLRSAGEDMAVSVRPDHGSSQVDLVVTPRLGWLQVVDWGEASMFAREIAERLEAVASPRG
jgi:hypothetical protein